MLLSNHEMYIPEQGQINDRAEPHIVNVLVIELLNQGVLLHPDVIVALLKAPGAYTTELCKLILKTYTLGSKTPPLFPNWEDRTSFTSGDMLLQVLQYQLHINLNEINNNTFARNVMRQAENTIEYTPLLKTLKLGTRESAQANFNELARTVVPVDKIPNLQLGIMAGFHTQAPNMTPQARAQVLVHTWPDDAKHPVDVLRGLAAAQNPESWNLPSGVEFRPFDNKTRQVLFAVLNSFDPEVLLEAFMSNQRLWWKLLTHARLVESKQARRKYPRLYVTWSVATGSTRAKMNPSAHPALDDFIRQGFVEETPRLIYRSFKSRVESVSETGDLELIKEVIGMRYAYLLANLQKVLKNVPCSLSLTEYLAHAMQRVKTHVLLPLASINPSASHRVIDVKGVTVVVPTNYRLELMTLAKRLAIECLRERLSQNDALYYAKDPALDIHQPAPFLAKNQELVRGRRTLITKPYLYFMMHWVEGDKRTDLDHSWVTINTYGVVNIVSFVNQANEYIAQSGDIVSAPAPDGGTEYSVIRFDKIPEYIVRIAPVVTVFAGNNFAECESATVGFFQSDEPHFHITNDFMRMKISQPVRTNIPFFLQRGKHGWELIETDYRKAQAGEPMAGSEVETVKMVMTAASQMTPITIQNVLDWANSPQGSSAKAIGIIGEGKPKTDEDDLWPSELGRLIPN